MFSSNCNQTLVLQIDKWDDALILHKYLDRWLFRGQRDSDWLLKTTVERALEYRRIDFQRLPVFELMALDDFRKIAHNFSTNLPEYDDMLTWLSIIQHYGGPTRLLDFTTSFYIAVYFALVDATNSCAIWALNRPELIKLMPTKIEKILIDLGYKRPDEKLPANFMNLILQRAIAGDIDEKFILTASPAQLNERQYIQQGLSVIPTNLKNGFMDSLLESFAQKCILPDESNLEEISIEKALEYLQRTKILKLVLLENCFLDARLDLNKMSINSLTLFRGLDGLGKHLYDILNSLEYYKKKYAN